MSKLQDIVTIKIEPFTKLNYVADYCIVTNGTVQEVISCAEDFPNAFVFPFDTTPVDKIKSDMIDYTPLYSEGEVQAYKSKLVECLYIGNFKKEDQDLIMKQWIDNCLGKDTEKNLVFTNNS